MPRHRGCNYEKNLAKRMRSKDKPKQATLDNKCFSCGHPPEEFQIKVGQYIICNWCYDKLIKIGYLQIHAFKRLYRDGSIRNERYVIRDVLTGRIN